MVRVLLTLLSIFTGFAVLVALFAVWRARAAARRIERLSESYWELRYESGQLKARVTRLEVETGLREAAPDAEKGQPAATTTFVPLSSLKK
jgi:hypothetical protein